MLFRSRYTGLKLGVHAGAIHAVKKRLHEPFDIEISDYAAAFRYEESRSKAPLLYGEAGDDESRRIIGYLNIKWFLQTLLDRMDRTSMYSELEARVPFADHRIIDIERKVN